jgi:hypothetical protein
VTCKWRITDVGHDGRQQHCSDCDCVGIDGLDYLIFYGWAVRSGREVTLVLSDNTKAEDMVVLQLLVSLKGKP